MVPRTLGEDLTVRSARSSAYRSHTLRDDMINETIERLCIHHDCWHTHWIYHETGGRCENFDDMLTLYLFVSVPVSWKTANYHRSYMFKLCSCYRLHGSITLSSFSCRTLLHSYVLSSIAGMQQCLGCDEWWCKWCQWNRLQRN